MQPVRPPPPPTHRARFAVMTLIVAAAVAGLILAFSRSSSPPPLTKPAAVESVFPQGGDLDLRQTTIGADLAPGYTGYLELDGVEVADDDLQHIDALNQVILKPQSDSVYKELPPGRHCAGVVYRLIGQPRESSNTYHWCFSLH